jgi:hypothetical protein
MIDDSGKIHHVSGISFLKLNNLWQGITPGNLFKVISFKNELFQNMMLVYIFSIIFRASSRGSAGAT